MATRILQIVETAFRATLEEQDDPVLWLTASLKGNGLGVDLLLRGNAVGYLVRGQDTSGLAFGERTQTQPPNIPRDLEALVGKGVRILYVEEDARTRGLERGELIEGPQPIPFAKVPELFAEYQQVWHW